MENKVHEFILNENLINDNDKIVIGVSGGIDSMVLLNILHNLKYNIVIAHVNHNVRIESNDELLFVKNYANTLNIPFETTTLPKIENTNFEAEARRLRYEFFFDVARKYNCQKIATAHHLDDLFETILMRISRGSNLYGYGGIKPNIDYGNISIIRPLLCINRSEIKSYQEENNIPFMEDSSNSNNLYTRNRFRHNIIPLLVKENPSIYENIYRYSKQMYQAFDYIRKESIKLYSKNKGEVINDEFKTLSDAVKLDYLSYILEENDIPCSYNKLNEIKDMLLNDKPNGSINIGEKYIFVKEYKRSFVKYNEKIIDYDFYLNINEEKILPNGDKIKITQKLENNEVIFLKLCYNTLVLPLRIRNKRDGDYFEFAFGKKKIKDLFIDMKIPSYTRKTVPFVLDNNGKILGIPGIIKGPKDVVNPIYIIYEVKKNDAR